MSTATIAHSFPHGGNMIAISKAQYKSALQAEGVLRDRSVELLAVLNDAPSCRATATQLSQVLGYEDYSPINALIGQLGKRIANHLGIEVPDRPSKSPGWWQIVATGEYVDDGFAWSLRPELLDALVELGLLAERENQPFPETAAGTVLTEGAMRRVNVNAFERNQTARAICIRHHGAVCSVCGFDFERTYGAMGRGFIHVHHLLDLAEIAMEYQVDPINDLAPVCPNCHAMLHTQRPALAIAEMQVIVERHKG